MKKIESVGVIFIRVVIDRSKIRSLTAVGIVVITIIIIKMFVIIFIFIKNFVIIIIYSKFSLRVLERCGVIIALLSADASVMKSLSLWHRCFHCHCFRRL